MGEDTLSNIGTSALTILDAVQKWTMNLSPTALVGLAIVIGIVFLLVRVVVYIIRLIFRHWYVRGILHDKGGGRAQMPRNADQSAMEQKWTNASQVGTQTGKEQGDGWCDTEKTNDLRRWRV